MKPKLDIGSTGFGIFPLSLYLSPDLKKVLVAPGGGKNLFTDVEIR